MAAVDEYKEFNDFQQAFYCNPTKFAGYSRFEIRKNGYRIIANILKAFPHRAIQVYNMKGFGWSGPESKEIMTALSMSFITRNNRLPDFCYWKTNKAEKDKTKAKKTELGLIFDDSVIFEICSILKLDSKTYDYLKFTNDVQSIGKQIIGECIQTEKSKPNKKTK